VFVKQMYRDEARSRLIDQLYKPKP